MTEFSSSPELDAHKESYEYYQQLLAPLNEAHPQKQGLTEEEFAVAFADPNVIKTTLEVDGNQLALPQLAPISAFEWLNTPVYEAKFPGKIEEGKLLHFTQFEGVEPGDEVKARLIELANDGGTLVFDYPANLEGYEDQLASMLSSLGIESTSEDLAVQTYFSGQISFKRREPAIPGEQLGLMEAYDDMNTSGVYDTSRILNGASAARLVDIKAAEYMNQFYDDAYVDLNAKEFCKQGLDSDEFLHMMTEESDVTKIINTVDGEIVSLLLLESDLSKLSWVNADYYKKRYPEKYENDQVVWFPGLAANPNHPASMNTQVMVNLIAEMLEHGGNDINVVFDCGNINTGFLDAFLNDMINKVPQTSIDIQQIAQQKYGAFQLSPKSQ